MRLTLRPTAAQIGGLLLLGRAFAMGPAQPVAGQGLTVQEYEPRNTLVVPEHIVTGARFPFVDIHGHQNGTRMSSADVDRLVGEMDELNMAVMVNLSGGSGASLVRGLENMIRDHAGRFVFFANVDFEGVGEPGWGERAAAQLEADVRAGAAGLKPPGRSAPFEQIIGEQHNLFRKHPGTRFIAAHLGWLGNDLARLGKLLDELPNVYVGLGAVVYELGRQPRFAKEWLLEYQDRVLMGKDSYDQEEYHTYFRVFETADEYFDYYRRYHAFWQMYGLDLPDEVLRKIYYENALELVPAIDRSFFPG